MGFWGRKGGFDGFWLKRLECLDWEEMEICGRHRERAKIGGFEASKANMKGN